ncbi:MAG: hypothetical protein FWG67_01790, partial [Defluviitaleaceae bacterium]|nr:hypothetical protein [Defluviitaleaceae bacterium]
MIIYTSIWRSPAGLTLDADALAEAAYLVEAVETAAIETAVEELTVFLTELNQLGLNEANFTPESWTVFTAALDDAREVVDDFQFLGNQDLSSARGAYEDLADAFDALVEATVETEEASEVLETPDVDILDEVDKEADKEEDDLRAETNDRQSVQIGEGIYDVPADPASDLTSFLIELEWLELNEADFTSESWEIFLLAVAEAEAVLAVFHPIDNNDLEAIATAHENLSNAFAGLRFEGEAGDEDENLQIGPRNTGQVNFNFQFDRPITALNQMPVLRGVGPLSYYSATNPASFSFQHQWYGPPFNVMYRNDFLFLRVSHLADASPGNPFFLPTLHHGDFDQTTNYDGNEFNLSAFPHRDLSDGIHEVRIRSWLLGGGAPHTSHVIMNLQRTSSLVRVDHVENIALANSAPEVVVDPENIELGRPAGYEHSGHFDINWRIEYADGTAWNELDLNRITVPTHATTQMPVTEPGERLVSVDLDPIRPIDWRRPGVNPPVEHSGVEDGDAHSSADAYARSEHGSRLQTGVVYTVRVNVREDVPPGFPLDPTIYSESIGRFSFTSPPTLDKFGSTDFAQVGETVTYTLRVENNNGVPLNDEFEVVDYIRTDLVALNGDFSPVTPTIGTPQTILLYDEDGNPWYDEDGVRLTGEVT